MDDAVIEDAMAGGPLERLLEDSWPIRWRHAGRRELVVESIAALAFLGVAVPLALPALSGRGFDPWLAVMLVGVYAIVARTIRFPIGAGYVVGSYLVLVPMLLLLPPATVPLLADAGLVAGGLVRVAARRDRPDRVLLSIPDAWHTVGPAVVLVLAGRGHGGIELADVYVGAFVAGGVVDLIASTAREAGALAIAPRVQVRVIAVVWLVDACIAPLGLLVAHATRHQPAQLLLIVPLAALFVVVDRDRTRRIAEAQRRLGLVAQERTRLQAAVSRLGDAFGARLDLRALSAVLLDGSIDALGGECGQVVLGAPGADQLVLRAPSASSITATAGPVDLEPLLDTAVRAVEAERRSGQFERDGAWALALPIVLDGDRDGWLVIARRDRGFRDDEQALMVGLVERARQAAAEIIAHERLREQAITDPLTRLGNRRKLADDLRERLAKASTQEPLVLMLFDLDGFKTYNDTFGHAAGDALLARLGGKLATAIAPDGDAYRLGGDEFCVLVRAHPSELHELAAAAAGAFVERGETFSIRASSGAVILPHEAGSADDALQLADKRMYSRKHGRPSVAREQAAQLLCQILQANTPGLDDHGSAVAELAVSVGRRLGMSVEQLGELARAAELHDIGNVGIPDAILDKPGPLDAKEWEFLRQHTVLGERILRGAPALRSVATIVRSTHERWDGGGYPDGLEGQAIPLGARVIAVCDAYDAIVTDRCYRGARSPAAARAELRREADRQFDPTVVAALLDELETRAVGLRIGRPGPDDDPARLATEVASRVSEMLERC